MYMYKLNSLNYGFDELEPFIDKKTVEIHYGKHHTNYLNKLNDILTKNNYSGTYELEELASHLEVVAEADQEAFLFNLGGVLNHNLYWEIMSPNKNIIPTGKFADAVNAKYGDFESLKAALIAKCNSMMGSGWVFLVLKDKELEIVQLSNQDTPYKYGMIPLIGIDLWEHAYYLKYQNLRADYIINFFNVVDFEKVNQIYEKNI